MAPGNRVRRQFKKVVVIGATGQLGSELCREFSDIEVVKTGREDAPVFMDLSKPDEFREILIHDLVPDLVINTAAAHNVPRCEECPDESFAVNATAAGHLAAACRSMGARLVHLSTDYVFGDQGTRPHVETDLPAPLNVYGASKLAGEHLISAEYDDCAIVRTSALYGLSPCRAKEGKNFVQLMLHLASTQSEIRVVIDEVVTPTYVVDLARQIRVIAEQGASGLYHATCQGACSWYEFAQAIFEETKTEVELIEATRDDFPSPVRRPFYSVLENENLKSHQIDVMPDWRSALSEYLSSIGSGSG